jgi:hypothetical protein
MPVPYLESLTAAARKALPFITRGVREGLSSRELSAALSAQGLGLRRQSLLDLMRLTRADWDAQKALQNARPDLKIRPELLPEALTKLRRSLSYTAEIRGTAGDTGKEVVQHVTITSDQVMTPTQVEETASQVAERERGRYGLDIVSVRFTGGRRAGAAGTF